MKANAIYLLKEIYKENRNNYTATAEFLGMPNARSLEYYLKEQREIPLSMYERMLEKCPEVSAEWLMRGEGAFEREPALPVKKTPLIDQENLQDILIDGDVKIKGLCKYYTLPMQADYLMVLHTDELSPMFPKGCILALKNVDGEYTHWGSCYALLTNQGFMYRRVQLSPNDDMYLLVSFNEKYAPLELPQKTIINKALIVGMIDIE